MKTLLDKKIARKIHNAKKEGLFFLLTHEQVQILLNEARITPKEWCLNGFNLARINDEGNYEMGNCRFIPWLENQRERNFSENQRAVSARNMQIAHKNATFETLSIAGKLGAKLRKENNIYTGKKCEKGCDCKRHTNCGGQNKNIPHTKETINKIRKSVYESHHRIMPMWRNG